jgi:hypothetical protein
VSEYEVGEWSIDDLPDPDEPSSHVIPDCSCGDWEEGHWDPRCAEQINWKKALLRDERGHGWSFVSWLPTSVIVGSVEVVRCLPIVGWRGDIVVESIFLSRRGPETLWHQSAIEYGGRSSTEISDQLPFCDWSPGRWACELVDPVLTTERCPVCGGSGSIGSCAVEDLEPDQALVEAWGYGCDTCDGSGKCEPIPAKGRPGIWEWTP